MRVFQNAVNGVSGFYSVDTYSSRANNYSEFQALLQFQVKVNLMAYTSTQFLKMSAADLDALFHQSPAGAIPNGAAKGTAIVVPGTWAAEELAGVVNVFAWQGKTFDGVHGTLTNRITALGINAIVAEVYKAPSLFDGNECIVLDYSKTSLVAEHIRDEIREVSPGVYLGLVYWDQKKTIHFALEFPNT